MPTQYRGRVIIQCLKEACVIDKARESVGADCLACDHSTQAVVDLDDKTVGYLKKPATEEAESEKPETAAEKGKKKW